MAVDKSRYSQMKRKMSRRSSSRYPSEVVSGIASDQSANNTGSYEKSRMRASGWDRAFPKDDKGRFVPKAERNQDKTIARQIRKNSSLRGNDYEFGTKAQVDAQHRSRYRQIRGAFGMSAG